MNPEEIARIARETGRAVEDVARELGSHGGKKAWEPWRGGAWRRAVSKRLKKAVDMHYASLNALALDDIAVADNRFRGFKAPTYESVGAAFQAERERRAAEKAARATAKARKLLENMS